MAVLKPQTRREQRRAQLEHQLLEAAENLTRDGTSFTELTVDQLAGGAGIVRATFYKYFEDKGHLLRQLARQVFGELSQDAEHWWQSAERRDPHDLQAAVGRIIASYRRHQVVIGALNEMAAYDPLVATTYRDLMVAISARLADVIRRGQADGTIRTQISPQATASCLTWMVERACHQNLPNEEPPSDDELGESLTQIIWAALYLEAV
jgi:AcrR family transcriptional regulator